MTNNRISDCFSVTMRCSRAPHALVFVVMLAVSFIASQPAQAQLEPAYTFSVLHTFDGTNGANPDGALIMDAVGSLYSTTIYGGNTRCLNSGEFYGCGTVLKLNKSGKQTMLYKFPRNGTHGKNPNAGLVADKAGNLYGVTGTGGAIDGGTVFMVDKAGKETVLYSFTGGQDGGNPNSSLIFDRAEDNLYGTTEGGGDETCGTPFTVNGCGVVFKVNKTTGKETVLYAFTASTDGALPIASVIMDSKGNLYGTTALGGDLSCTYYPTVGCGVVFEIDKSTGKESVLYAFTGGDGFFPAGALYRDKAGSLYGTTLYGGGYGNVFKLDTNQKETVLYNFTGGTDGGDPDAGLITDAAGNFYSTTSLGGDLSCSTPMGAGCGVVFKLNKTTNKETVLYSFTGKADGAVPAVSLLRDAAGNLYGTTYEGGDPLCSGKGITGCGTVFKLAP